jgi:hypothetical protein
MMMRKAMLTIRKSFHSLACTVLIAALPVIWCVAPGHAGKYKQLTFATPEEAAGALVEAAKADNHPKLLAIVGSQAKDLLATGDEVADSAARERFVKAYEEKNNLEQESPERFTLEIGRQNWPFPIPLVKAGGQWRFDTEAGKDELLTRRIGRNELSVMEVLQAYVDAQQEYAGKDRNGEGVLQFAQKIVSSEGKHNGLYWPAGEGEEESPLGPLAARAAAEGYKRKAGDQPTPFHGYYFHILTGQGPHAPGGAYKYVVKGHMLLGFAMAAYPAKYGSSGIMTFLVNQEGVIYEKDLGRNTAKIAGTMKLYDPDKSWTKAQLPMVKAD